MGGAGTLPLLGGAFLLTALLIYGLGRVVLQLRLGRRLTALAGPVPRAAPQTQAAPKPWFEHVERVLVLGEADREDIVAGLQAAGRFEPADVAVFALARVGLTLLAAGMSVLLLRGSGYWHGLFRVVPLFGALTGFVLSKLALGRVVARHKRLVSREIPFMLDMMILILEAGSGLDQCFRQIAQVVTGGMPRTRRSIVMLVDDIQRGMPYERALQRWAGRLGVNGAQELAALFRQTLLHGTEIGPALREFRDEFADRRVAAAREQVGKKTTQMTLVMMMFLMPALMTILAGPAVAALINAFGQLSASQ